MGMDILAGSLVRSTNTSSNSRTFFGHENYNLYKESDISNDQRS